VRFDSNRTAPYNVGKSKKELGAAAALKTAFQEWGGHCFHCKNWMPPQPLSQGCRETVSALGKKRWWRRFHNLVFACGSCNRSKGGADLITFSAEVDIEYITMLESDLARCIRMIASENG
jgi:hypothetical protein